MKRLTALLLALLMVLTLTGCYSEAEYYQAIEEAKDAATEKAKTEWYEIGLKEGRSEGKEEGLIEGYENGYDVGHDIGYHDGYQTGRDEGYNTGYAAGKEAGKSNSGNSSGGGGSGGGTGGSSGGGGGNYTNDDDDITVYVTKTGEKYHYSWCGYLHSSKIAKTLSSAKAAGYTPCSRCNPPS